MRRPDDPLRVLVVDDNADAATSLAILVESWGHEVRTAHNGMTAIETARAFGPEVVLLDIGLPGMDGFQVAPMLRALPGMGRAFLVASSGYNRDQDRRRALDAGIDLYLVKPFDPERLERILAAHRRSLGALSA